VWASRTAGPAGEAYNLGTLWELCMITAISAIAGMTQLGFLTTVVEKAARDALTGLFTRRFAEQIFALQFEVSVRSDSPISVLFVDLDHFKSVNDRFGHEAGDRVLATAADRICQTLRHQDIVARWGGEEFLVVLPNTDLAGANAAIDRIAASGLGDRPDGSPVTASIGVAERRRDKAPDWPALAKIADERLYHAKNSGRNCMVGPDGLLFGMFRATVAKAPA
jgi:diguanylate cyclase (GGDEF)-like protein